MTDWIRCPERISMIAQPHIVLALCNVGGLIIVIPGGLMFAWGLLAHGGAGALMKAGGLLFVAMWFSSLGL